MQNIPICIPYQGMLLTGYAKPTSPGGSDSFLSVYIQGWCLGQLKRVDEKWTMDQPIDPKFVYALGKCVDKHFRMVQPVASD